MWMLIIMTHMVYLIMSFNDVLIAITHCNLILIQWDFTFPQYHVVKAVRDVC